MRARFIAPQALLSAAGVTGIVGVLTGAWALAFGAGLLTGTLVGVVSSIVLFPLFARLRALGRAVRQAAGTLGQGGLAPDEDELDVVLRTVRALDASWSRRLADQSDELTTLLAVLDGMAEGVWVTDAHGTIVRHNETLARMLPSIPTLVGQRPIALIRSTELHDAVMAACTDATSSQVEVRLEGIPPRILSVQVIPLGRGLPGSAAVFHDLTELRRLEEIRKDFVANVSHELRTPITAIRGYAETLRAGALDDPEHAPRMVEIIHRQSERLASLVADLLELSRLEARESKLERIPVPLFEAATRALDAIGPRAAEKAIEVHVDIDPSLRALGDPRAIEQVLVNLMDNAVKYTPGGGRVSVQGLREGGRVGLLVRDTGPGIDEKYLPRIFERFYRIDKGRSRETGGTGLGLSIVKHLVGAMGGEVRVTSRVGEGTCFTLLFDESHAAAVSG